MCTRCTSSASYRPSRHGRPAPTKAPVTRATRAAPADTAEKMAALAASDEDEQSPPGKCGNPQLVLRFRVCGNPDMSLPSPTEPSAHYPLTQPPHPPTSLE
eukprot:scaffold1864_cov106-Isochrysis_galbana.AAC.7